MIINKNVNYFIKNILNLDLDNDIIFIKDEDFRYIYVNDVFCKLFDINLSQVIGKKDSDFILDKNLLNTCSKSDSYAFENNFIICTEKTFDIDFKVLKLKIDLGEGKIGILCFAKIKNTAAS